VSSTTFFIKTTPISVQNSGTNLHMISYYQQRTLGYKVPDNQLIEISDLIHLSSIKKNNDIIVSIRRIPPEREHSNNGFSDEEAKKSEGYVCLCI